MVKIHYALVISRQKLCSEDPEFEKYALRTINNDYYVMYCKPGEVIGYLTEESYKKEKLSFIGLEEIFSEPFEIIVKSEIV